MQHERRFYRHYWHYLGGTHVAANEGEIMAYVACGEIVFDDLPEYPECENTYEANAAAYERDIWDGLTNEDLLNLDLPF